LAIRVGAPLAAAAVLAAACSSGTHGSPATPASPGASAAGGGSSASTVDVHTSNGTSFLTDSAGRSLYLWTPDTTTKSMCSGACAAAWPPLTVTGTATAGAGATASDLATISRSDGTKQVSYDGHPLYYFAGDSGAGQTNGEGVNGFGAPWYLVAPSGQQITSLSGAPMNSSPSSGGLGY
jgi:predicted lipoprotein with Yx(FWY)xxD motif